MANTPHSLYLGLNPQLTRFDWPLFNQLNQQVEVQYWNYRQKADEPCCVETVLGLLHAHMKRLSQPVHLIGHSLSGAIALVYSRLYPNRVKSLTLLSVGANPATSWHAHYYSTRQFLACNRTMVLVQMARMLFGPQCHGKTMGLAKLLAQVLDTEFAPHSLVHHSGFSPGGVEVPLLVCNGSHDAVIDPKAHADWQPWLKPGDRLWSCPEGRHFFHHEHSGRSSQVILDFWQQVHPIAHLPLVNCP
jgi:pimeloyl-ACP methyl ester carboxylesterase